MTESAVDDLTAMKSAFAALVPLPAERRPIALQWLASALGVQLADLGVSGSPSAGASKYQFDPLANIDDLASVSPKQFMATKRPLTDVERITCLAYYMTHGRGTLHFKTQDLTALNTEAAGLKFSNAAQASNNAMNQNGYLAQAGQGKRQITPRGEAMVQALPDREAVQAALAEFPKKFRRGGRRKSG